MKVTNHLQIVIQHLIEVPVLCSGLCQNHRKMQTYSSDIKTTYKYRLVILICRSHASSLIPGTQERTASHGADDSLVFFIHFRDISFSAHGQPIWIHGFGRAFDTCFKYILADTAFSMNLFVIKKYNLRKQYRLFVPRFTLSALMHMQQRNIAHLCKPFLSKSKGYCHKRIISTGRSYRI